MATTTSGKLADSAVAEEMLKLYGDVLGKVGTKYGETSTVAAATAAEPLWDDKYCVPMPAFPKNASRTVTFMDILGTDEKKLGLPDLDIFAFTDEDWPEEARCLIPSMDDPDIKNYIIPHKAGYWVLYGLLYNKSTFASGVKGCGKSALYKYLCAKLRWPMVRINFDKHMDTTEVFGNWEAVVEDGCTVTKYTPGNLPQACLGGYVVVLDEVTQGPPEVHPALHYILERGGKMFLKGQGGAIADKIIEPADSFRIGATDNTKGQGDTRGLYAGADQMNSAFMDRFSVMVVMDYMSRDQELTALRKTVPGLTPKLAGMMLDVASKVRAAYKQGDLTETLSMRGLIEWAEKSVLTRKIKESLWHTTLNKMESESEVAEFLGYYDAVFGGVE